MDHFHFSLESQDSENYRLEYSFIWAFVDDFDFVAMIKHELDGNGFLWIWHVQHHIANSLWQLLCIVHCQFLLLYISNRFWFRRRAWSVSDSLLNYSLCAITWIFQILIQHIRDPSLLLQGKKNERFFINKNVLGLHNLNTKLRKRKNQSVYIFYSI